ncbi:MAG: leucine-rich repeat domain-containing protein [Bacteroidia bacterium]|nr:leucine-rich repeat domain-containing protein [Bacteroidia bacterium]MCC6768526.1 leucine-rich repeat domain-containing protein [Bacteroidia bacterium]
MSVAGKHFIGWLAIFIVLAVSQTKAQPSFKVGGKVFTSIEKASQQPDSVIRLRLKRRGLREIPPAIFQFKNLRELDLSSNKLKYIPKELYQLEKLEVLRLTRNRIVRIDSGIGRLQQLTYIDLGMNPIQELPAEFGHLKQLQFLQLWGTEITWLPESIAELPVLRWLDMRNIILTESEREDLIRMFPKTTLYLSEGCNCVK